MRKSVILTTLILAIVMLFASCGSSEADTVSTAPADSVKTIFGKQTAAHNFIWEVVDPDGTTIHSFKVFTDKTKVSDALSSIGLATFADADAEEGTEAVTFSSYPLDADYEWAFYINGERSKQSPTEVTITDGDIYSFAMIKK